MSTLFLLFYGHVNLIIDNNCLINRQVIIIPVNYGFKGRHISFKEQTQSRGELQPDIMSGIATGVTIGNSCVIGAGAVIAKSIKSYSIVV
ncbi:hypothetical protein IQ264_23535 [Phormidium sp. LEGE 05292]|uniref:hypothetical protein n=1 Tax=[Phormidium] sp. LEGE 05292 TaxID=767427 RepID=UPI00188180DA|nr:hypothetical protein [Phormidium sp. LEGE 05292]MBE9228397.1 hypothetical protein [Phormidium sp. LEGE 05292]